MKRGCIPGASVPPWPFFLGCLLWAALVARSSEFRGLWVDAWGAGFLNSSQTSQLVSDCRKYNFNAVVVQMRRRGDAFYMPQSPDGDPRTTAVASTYDALADLIAQCHSGSPRLEVHCWVVSNLIWSGGTPPSQPGHVFNLHPEYLMKDFAGQTQISEGHYLDPGHPEAMLWNYRMAMDIVSRYDVDGFHWDYIRYPQQNSGYNDTALARYNAEFGLTGKPSSSDARFATWRRRQVTDFLRWVSADLLAVKPALMISTAVFSNRSDAYTYRFQDWAAWTSEGIIDLCLPMDYSADNSGVFNPRVDDAMAHQGVRRVYVGQGAYLNPKENTVAQLNYVRNKGLLGTLLYSYRTCNSGTVNQADTFGYIKTNYQPAWTAPPTLPWKATPTKGIAKGTVTRQGSTTPVYNATVTLNTVPARTQKTEAHGKFAFFEVPPGTFTMSVTAPGMGSASGVADVTAGRVVTVDLAVPATDTTPPVITGQPADQIVHAGATAAFSVVATGSAPMSYQWRFNGLNIAAGTKAVLTLTNVQTSAAGEYVVVVTNAAGAVTSAVARLTVTLPVAVRIESISLLSDGRLHLLAGGEPGSRYAIQISTNLVDWTELSTVEIVGGTFEFIDPDRPNLPQRFYRVRLVP
ncbi:MAG: family 10 glycosylhydrolase [Verrucomicrobiota bacterium]